MLTSKKRFGISLPSARENLLSLFINRNLPIAQPPVLLPPHHPLKGLTGVVKIPGHQVRVAARITFLIGEPKTLGQRKMEASPVPGDLVFILSPRFGLSAIILL